MVFLWSIGFIQSDLHLTPFAVCSLFSKLSCLCRKRTSRCMSATVRTSLVPSPYGDSTLTVPSFRSPVNLYALSPLVLNEELLNTSLLGIKHSLFCFLFPVHYQECQRKLEHKLGLDSYLLKPVQRLTKYQLLLKVRVS